MKKITLIFITIIFLGYFTGPVIAQHFYNKIKIRNIHHDYCGDLRLFCDHENNPFIKPSIQSCNNKEVLTLNAIISDFQVNSVI